MKQCPVGNCTVVHADLLDAYHYHEARGEWESGSVTSTLSKNYEGPVETDRSYTRRKPSLDDYDRGSKKRSRF